MSRHKGPCASLFKGPMDEWVIAGVVRRGCFQPSFPPSRCITWRDARVKGQVRPAIAFNILYRGA